MPTIEECTATEEPQCSVALCATSDDRFACVCSLDYCSKIPNRCSSSVCTLRQGLCSRCVTERVSLERLPLEGGRCRVEGKRANRGKRTQVAESPTTRREGKCDCAPESASTERFERFVLMPLVHCQMEAKEWVSRFCTATARALGTFSGGRCCCCASSFQFRKEKRAPRASTGNCPLPTAGGEIISSRILPPVPLLDSFVCNY